MGPDKTPETIEEYNAAVKAAQPRTREESTPDARRLGLMIAWVLKDQFKDSVGLIQYAKRKNLPVQNVALWLEANVTNGAYGNTFVTDMHGKRFVVSVREVIEEK